MPQNESDDAHEIFQNDYRLRSASLDRKILIEEQRKDLGILQLPYRASSADEAGNTTTCFYKKSSVPIGKGRCPDDQRNIVNQIAILGRYGEEEKEDTG